MTKDYACFYCFAGTSSKLIEKNNLSEEQKTEFTQYLAQLGASEQAYSSPEFLTLLHRKLKQLSGIEELYANEKQESNTKAQELAKQWLPKILHSDHAFDLTLRLAIAGNIMDYGAPTNQDIDKTIDYVLRSDFAINHSPQLFDDIKKAKQILYLGDNAGEIVFDKLFISNMHHANVYYAVRGYPVLNDVTQKDANELAMNEVATIISNGYDAPSTMLDKCSPEFIEIWNNSDIIISKGQGNLEGLLENKTKNIYFLLMVKCKVIAQHLNVTNGEFVVYNQTKLKMC